MLKSVIRQLTQKHDVTINVERGAGCIEGFKAVEIIGYANQVTEASMTILMVVAHLTGAYHIKPRRMDHCTPATIPKSEFNNINQSTLMNGTGLPGAVARNQPAINNNAATTATDISSSLTTLAPSLKSALCQQALLTQQALTQHLSQQALSQQLTTIGAEAFSQQQALTQQALANSVLHQQQAAQAAGLGTMSPTISL